MTSYRRNFLPGWTYFFTVNLAERQRRLLTDHIEELRAAFRYARTRHPFTIEAIVVLPDHLHAIWTLPEGERDFALRWRLIKAAFSHGCPEMNGYRPVARAKANAAYGSGAIGSTRCGTDMILRGTRITFISIRLSTATSRE